MGGVRLGQWNYSRQVQSSVSQIMRIPYKNISKIYQIQIIANENISSSSWEITNNTTNSAFRCKSDSRIQVFEVHSSICIYPLCCAFSYVSSGLLDKMIHDYTDCISLAYFHHVFSHICVLRTLGCEYANLPTLCFIKCVLKWSA